MWSDSITAWHWGREWRCLWIAERRINSSLMQHAVIAGLSDTHFRWRRVCSCRESKRERERAARLKMARRSIRAQSYGWTRTNQRQCVCSWCIDVSVVMQTVIKAINAIAQQWHLWPVWSYKQQQRLQNGCWRDSNQDTRWMLLHWGVVQVSLSWIKVSFSQMPNVSWQNLNLLHVLSKLEWMNDEWIRLIFYIKFHVCRKMPLSSLYPDLHHKLKGFILGQDSSSIKVSWKSVQ